MKPQKLFPPFIYKILHFFIVLRHSILIISLRVRIYFIFNLMFSIMYYDPITNWNCQNADPAPDYFKRKLPLRKEQLKSVVNSLSIDDGLNKNTRFSPI